MSWAGQVQKVTLIKAHSNVLCAHSPVFAASLGATWAQRVAAATSGVAMAADHKVPYSVEVRCVDKDCFLEPLLPCFSSENLPSLHLDRTADLRPPSNPMPAPCCVNGASPSQRCLGRLLSVSSLSPPLPLPVIAGDECCAGVLLLRGDRHPTGRRRRGPRLRPPLQDRDAGGVQWRRRRHFLGSCCVASATAMESEPPQWCAAPFDNGGGVCGWQDAAAAMIREQMSVANVVGSSLARGTLPPTCTLTAVQPAPPPPVLAMLCSLP